MTESVRIVNVLSRIETWVVVHGATMGLRASASEADVSALEAELAAGERLEVGEQVTVRVVGEGGAPELERVERGRA